MASYTSTAAEFGIYEKTLVASTVDTLTMSRVMGRIELITDGVASIFFTIDGSTPTVGGQGCYYVPAIACVREINLYPANTAAVIKLISVGIPKYSVSAAYS